MIKRPLLHLTLSLVAFTGCPEETPLPDAGMKCLTTADCAQGGPCEQVNCISGACKRAFLAAGTSAGAQTAGDCKRMACDGMGAVVSTNDDSDVPADGNDCTADLCQQGQPSHQNFDAGTRCGSGLALTCLDGMCQGCRSPSECSPATECSSPTCVGGTCGRSNVARGTALAQQTAGDCKVAQCDGDGGTVQANDDTDVAVDSETCTQDRCLNGQSQHPPVQAGTPCTEGDGGRFCDGAGACAQCLVATDCPGSDTECRARSCVQGSCGARFTDAGVALATQTSGDCRRSVCDGTGSTASVADGTDLPNDNNACTTNACDAGAPWFPPVASGTLCGTNGVCNTSGVCVGCNVASDCGANDACKTFTCTTGACGLNLATAGTEVSNVSPGDCTHRVCDSQGNVVSANLDSEVPPDDGNSCTSEACVNGVPTHPLLATNAPCDAGFCSSAGQCVECNAPSQCPGSDTDCRARGCASGRCQVVLFDAGLVVPAQVSGDCKQNQCDGDGGVMTVSFDTDLPADDNAQCTSEVCSMGTPSHPPKAIDTACNQSGGLYCDGSGSCVECNSGTQCTSLVCSAATHSCQAATCMDGVQNGGETDVDCGGPVCSPCGPSKGCLANADCSGGACNTTTHLCAVNCSTDGSTCTSYCTCMTANCSTKFTSMAACLTACSAFVDAQICCRATHCGYAMTDPAGHCGHAAGESVCP